MANAVAMIKAGMEALDAAEAMLRALENQQAAAAVSALTKRLITCRAPLTLRELAVSGCDLLPLCQRHGQPAACLGGVLNALWESVLREELPNEKNMLLEMGDSLIQRVDDSPLPTKDRKKPKMA